MCITNHTGFAYPGYLIDANAESVAAKGALFTRTLAHHADIGLTAEQITGLLDVSREYHDRQNEIRVEMSQLAEQVELKRGRLDHDGTVARKPALDRRAALFAADEALFFEMAARGQALLSDEQIATIDTIYHMEKDAGLRDLTDALSNAVAPNYRFAAA
jgi:hypothetical protein